MTTRRRLRPEIRRERLLDAGEALFRSTEFDAVSMHDIAVEAGVTRALVYHYFDTKAELFGQVWLRAHEQLRKTAPENAETVRDWIEQLLTDYIEFYSENLSLVVVANRSSVSTHAAVRGPVDASFASLCQTLLHITHTPEDQRSGAEVAFGAWIHFTRQTTLATYLDGMITPEENLTLCMAAFDATVGRFVNLAEPIGMWNRDR